MSIHSTNWTSLQGQLRGPGDASVIVDSTFKFNFDYQINITGKKVILWGNDVVLDLAQKGRLFNFSNSELTLYSVTFANGTAPLGGALYAFSSTITMVDCNLSTNTATERGGAIFLLEIQWLGFTTAM